MKHECDPDWNQLGSLADGVLRAVAEKRKKHAEFLAAEKGPYEAPLQSSQEAPRVQLALPFPAESAPKAYARVGRH